MLTVEGLHVKAHEINCFLSDTWSRWREPVSLEIFNSWMDSVDAPRITKPSLPLLSNTIGAPESYKKLQLLTFFGFVVMSILYYGTSYHGV